MKTVSLAATIILIIIGVGYVVTESNRQNDSQLFEESAVSEAESIDTTALSKDDVSSDESASNTVSTIGIYTEYDEERIAQSDADHIFLFFHATWCPSCKALNADIVANAGNIPPTIEIYKVDYDTATDLKRKYGVTTQHSIIEIDANGAAESSITHPLTLEAILATI